MYRDVLILTLFVYFIGGILVSFTLSKVYYKPSINWVQNAPLATHVHKDKICFEWQGKYKTQVVSCIKRGN